MGGNFLVVLLFMLVVPCRRGVPYSRVNLNVDFVGVFAWWIAALRFSVLAEAFDVLVGWVVGWKQTCFFNIYSGLFHCLRSCASCIGRRLENSSFLVRAPHKATRL